ncbi:hypothetical protein DL765_000709 [Monosporascus sp. GIB2]|nr:hypothetical protein DL765_000709 [Monosporascus sp. GIB2]
MAPRTRPRLGRQTFGSIVVKERLIQASGEAELDDGRFGRPFQFESFPIYFNRVGLQKRRKLQEEATKRRISAGGPTRSPSLGACVRYLLLGLNVRSNPQADADLLN